MTLGYQRIEHVEHKGHQSCHGAQDKVPKAALVWCGRATWRGAHPVLGPPWTQGPRPFRHQLLLGLELLPNPGSLWYVETAISIRGGKDLVSLRPLGMTVLPGVTGAKTPAFRIKQQGDK